MYPNREKIMFILKRLRDEFGCVAIKTEFEAEGSRKDELIMLCDALRRANLPLTMKIGGCEAVRDMSEAKLFGAEAIMAPMIETPYAMMKYRQAAEKVYGECINQVEWIINVETKTCHENLDEVLTEGKGFLDTVCIGRSDYSGSLGLADEINGDEMFNRVCDIADRARGHGYHVTCGGKMLPNPEAVLFACKLAPHIDCYETRKVTFTSSDDPDKVRAALELAIEFEGRWLQTKHRYYESMAHEDDARLRRFESNLENGQVVTARA